MAPKNNNFISSWSPHDRVADIIATHNLGELDFYQTIIKSAEINMDKCTDKVLVGKRQNKLRERA